MGWVEDLFDGPYAGHSLELAEDSERNEREAAFIIGELGLEPDERVLDLACGHGRHAMYIAPKVGSLLGIDRTRAYLEYATNWSQGLGLANAEFVLGDMRELDYEGEFDAAYNYFTAWGYWDDETNLDILRRVCHALKPGGRFLLEFIHRDALMRRWSPKNWRQIDDALLLEESTFDFTTGRSINRRTYLRNNERHEILIELYMPTADALMRLFAQAGFTAIRAVAAPTGEALTYESFRMAVIGHRPADSQ